VRVAQRHCERSEAIQPRAGKARFKKRFLLARFARDWIASSSLHSSSQ
jgi:hypothetical protein